MYEISAANDEPIKFEDIDNVKVNAITLEKVKSLMDVQPQVYEDFSMVFEKFPYDNFLTQALYSVVSEFATAHNISPV